MGIRSRNKRSGWTACPNFRLEDASIDPYDLRVALWLFSHADTYQGKTNLTAISQAVRMSMARTQTSLRNLRELGIVDFDDGGEGRGGARRQLEIVVDWDTWGTPPSIRVANESIRVANEIDDPHLLLGEDQREDQSPSPPSASDSSPDEEALKGPERTPGQVANAIAKGYWDKIVEVSGKKPVSWSVVQMHKLVLPALEQYEPAEIKHALWALYESGTTVTKASLERELDGRARKLRRQRSSSRAQRNADAIDAATTRAATRDLPETPPIDTTGLFRPRSLNP